MALLYTSFFRKAGAGGDGGGATDPHFANVLLLCGCEGADGSTTLTDESTYGRTSTAVGTGQIDTAQFKFGTASALTNGSGNRFTFPDSNDWDFAGQFTVECWFRPSQMVSSAGRNLIAKRVDSSTWSWELFWTESATTPGIGFQLSTNGLTAAHNLSFVQGGLLAANTWYHLAVDRDATGKMRVYLDGVMKVSKLSATGTPSSQTNTLAIGGSSNNTSPHVGWIDEIRITGGVARYASDAGFTVPSAAFPRS